MKKRIFSRVLALAMALVLLSSTAFAAQVLNQENIGTFTGESGELLAHDGNGAVATSESENSYYDYYLGSDVVLDKTLVVQGGADAEIDLNGHTLQYLDKMIAPDTPNEDGYCDRFTWKQDKATGPVIKVTGEDTSLTVMDKVMEDGESSRGDETGIITGSNNGGISVEDGAEFTLSGGEITKIASRAVNVENGTFNMTGGVICDNKQNAVGGGVYVGADGTCNISGGEITHNWSGASGGGMYVANGGTVNMSGGKITDNFAKSLGGAVYVGADGTFTMSGGEISKNKNLYS